MFYNPSPTSTFLNVDKCLNILFRNVKKRLHKNLQVFHFKPHFNFICFFKMFINIDICFDILFRNIKNINTTVCKYLILKLFSSLSKPFSYGF